MSEASGGHWTGGGSASVCEEVVSRDRASGSARSGSGISAHPAKVSIVLPTYNGARYLATSVRSVVDQTWEDWELIVVDDCSDQPVQDLVQSFGDPRIHYMRNGANCGLPRSLNRGFALSSGEYLTWTSDDNWYGPNAIERMVTALDRNPRVALVCADFMYVDEAGNDLRQQALQPAIVLPEMDTVGACFLYRKRVQEVVGEYNPDAELAEDYEYWLRVHRRFRIGVLNECLYYYREHAGSLTRVHGRSRIAACARKVSEKETGLRRQMDLRAYRTCLRLAGWLRQSRLAPLLVPVRFLVGCTMRRYQKSFFISTRGK